MVLALGVDVSVARGLDVVLLDSQRAVRDIYAKVTVEGFGRLLREHAPDVVAIDSPPAFGRTGSSRLAERQLAALGISSYATPSQGIERPFYDWMRVGHEVFAEAESAGYPLYRSGDSVAGQSIEVFPHACAVVLAGRLPPTGTSRSGPRKRAWRHAVLTEAGVDIDPLKTTDLVDAALGALTGLLALEGTFFALGEAGEGVIVLPSRDVPQRYDRESPPASVGSGRTGPSIHGTHGLNAKAEIVAYQPSWVDEFEAIASRLRDALGNVAVRVDHIGSTSVPGLAAKDVIDVQATVDDLDAPGLSEAIERAGFRMRPDIVSDHRPPWDDRPDEDWRKRYADSHPGERRVHVHIRRQGLPNQRYALLFRDYLRADAHAASLYEVTKRTLADLTSDTATYADLKDPVCDLVMLAAERWAAETAWRPD